jgi:aryl-alcohol dehydrogenase-like predicted oxidoreductase
MKYRRLGRTRLRVSVIGVGTWQLSGEWGRRFTQHEVDELGRARELGVNLVDTAECYGDHLAEALIGTAIHQQRDDWVVATKFGHRFHPEAMQQARWSPVAVRSDHWTPKDVIAQLEASLRALRSDHVDIYQFHSGPDQAFDQDGLWEALHQQVAKGTVRHLGVSLGSNANVYQARRAADVGVSVVQVSYNRLDRTAEQGVLPVCLNQELGVLVREPLANGYLSGKYQPGSRVTASDDWRSGHDPAQVQRKLELVEQIRRTEVPEGVAMAPWALARCLQHPAVSCVVAGCKSLEQLESNASAADLDLVRNDHPQATVVP